MSDEGPQFDTRKTTYAEFVGVVADPASKELRVTGYITAGTGPLTITLPPGWVLRA